MKKNTKKTIIIIVASIITTIAAAGVLSQCSRGDDKTQTLNAGDYQVCLLDDASGKTDKDNKGGVSTKDYYKLEDLLSIELDKDADDVEYYVNIYDADKIFIQADKYTKDLTEADLTAYKNLGAVYFKVEIVNTEDEEISWLEKFSLVKAVEVTLGEAEKSSKESSTSNSSEAA